jgi:type IV pilus assembly protein PilM
LGKLLIGIDIGSRYIKIVILEQRVKFHLIDGFLFPTPIKTEKDGSRNIETEAFLKELEKLIHVSKLHGSKVSVNLPPASITALSVFLPLMSKKELNFAAINEAKHKMIPVTGPNHIFQCLSLGEVMVNKIPRAEVLVIRTEKIHVQRIIDTFNKIDVFPVLVSPSCTILPNIVPKEDWGKDASVVLVDIGAGSMNIAICREENMVFTRNIVYGIGDIIQDFTRQLNMEESKIEEILKEHGVPEVAFDLKDKVAIAEEIMRQKYEASLDASKPQESQVNLLELRLLWQPHIERITQELRRSFVFYKEQPEAKKIERLYFVGGGSSIKNLISILSGLIGLDCNVIHPSKDIPEEIPVGNKFKNDIISSSLFVNAESLALGIPIPKATKQQQVNFLPEELKQKESIAARRLIVLIIGICLISIFGLLSLQMFISSLALQKNIKKTENKLSKIQKVSERIKDLVKKESIVNRRSQQLEGLIKSRPDLVLPLKDLARIVPLEVLLSSSSLSTNKIEITASVFEDYEKAVKIIEELKRSLEKMKYLANIVITPLLLEKMNPRLNNRAGSSDVSLTEPKKREFSITADIVMVNQ